MIKDCLKKKGEEVDEKLTWLKIPKTTERQTALLDSIAPGSSLSMARKLQKRKPPPQVVLPSQDSINRNLPPLIIEVARTFLIKTAGTADIDSSLFMSDIRGSVSVETAEALEEQTRMQSDNDDWKMHRFGRITASKAHLGRTFMGPRGGWSTGRRKIPKSATKSVSSHSVI